MLVAVVSVEQILSEVKTVTAVKYVPLVSVEAELTALTIVILP